MLARRFFASSFHPFLRLFRAGWVLFNTAFYFKMLPRYIDDDKFEINARFKRCSGNKVSFVVTSFNREEMIHNGCLARRSLKK